MKSEHVQLEEFLQVVSALNDATRVRILAFILKYERVCVCDMENSFGMIQSRVSRHLKILKDAGFLAVEREGRWAYFFVAKLDDLRSGMLEQIKKLDLQIPERIHNCRT